MDAVTVFSIFDTLLGSTVFAFGMSRVLPMRLPAVFALVFVGTITLLTGFGYKYIDVWVGSALIFTAQCVLPFFLFKGPASVRAVSVLAAFVCEPCSTLVCYAAFSLLTGQPIPEDNSAYVQLALSHLPAYAISCLVSWFVLLLLLRFISVVARRFTGAEGDRSSLIFAAFVGVQIPLTMLLEIAVAMIDVDRMFLLCAVASCVLCLVADVLLFSSMDRALRVGKDKERARALNAALDACLEQCNAFVVETEQTAKMRHDVRNQVQVAKVLIERGEYVDARDHISMFRSLYFPK